jgi:hypothetical protein
VGNLYNVLKQNVVDRKCRLKLYCNSPVTFMRLWNLNIETKCYKKSKDSRDEFMWRTEGYSLLDHKRNGDILEIKADPAEKTLAQYKQKLLNHVSRMEIIRRKNNCVTIGLFGRKISGRPLKTTRRIKSWGRNRSFIGLFHDEKTGTD